MRRKYIIPILLLALAACIPPQPQTAPTRTPLQLAEMSYVQLSIGYETVMLSLQDARRMHLVTDQQWSKVDAMQREVRNVQPFARAILDSWRATGNQPANWTEALTTLTNALTELQRIYVEAKR